ncbi:Lipase class 3 [uncultured Sporomusa sp.]|uniref:Lipase class 3 n=1 Tax=uncultured Sporomusa sp. TaxID=307249 RepID=A0A212LNN0_9FIRM|nr:lipase family protein [uncultured Sporomusa sp.]SCM79137.1 Lipase class 3 [uncultured Sporomusa sp.]
MKRFLLVWLTAGLLLCIPIISLAGPQEDYEEAYKLYLTAGASAAAYSGRLGELANRYLEQDGWQIDHYRQAQGRTGARYLVARKAGVPYCLVAIVGTENKRDIKTDLKVSKVYFAGSNPAEFAANAVKKNIPNTEPKVHQGFNEFVQAGPSAVLRNPRQVSLSLPDLLRTDQTRKLLLTGHSLGGAAATLAGARLLSSGVNPDQLEVITFGAPAVGNTAFAAKYEPSLPLTRIVHDGDPITGVLQTLVGGYRQFGREIKWKPGATVRDAHQLTGYIDSALKNYYDKRRLAVEAGIQLPAQPAKRQTDHNQRVYILPLANQLPANLAAEFWYMQEALQDVYQNTLAEYVAANTQTEDWQQAALAAGCRWAIVSEVSASLVKEQKNTHYITVHQTIYDTQTGAVASTAVFSTGTYSLTPLEAFVHAFRGISDHLNSVMTQ